MDDLPPILVVDDELLVRLAMVDALKDGGYGVVEAVSGQTALEELERADQLLGLVTESGWGPVSMAGRLRTVLARSFPRSPSFM